MAVPIIDSNMTLEEALAGKKIPEKIRENLVLTDISYFSFDGLVHRGQLVVHKQVENELKEIFDAIFKIKFIVEKAVPVSAYGWSDEDSMSANNTSAFNYRLIYGTDRLSNHSYGLAVDINPFINPYIASDGKVFPADASYNPDKPGALKENDKVVSLFTSRGWEWGGRWNPKDWQHFQKKNCMYPIT
ncbi:MAG: M15 family metallopeptidase [Patescibacteria group bacterium]